MSSHLRRKLEMLWAIKTFLQHAVLHSENERKELLKKSEFHLHQRSPSDDLMYWTVKAGRTRENNELIHLGNLLKQIGKHLTTIWITGRITRQITGQITKSFSLNAKENMHFYEKLGLF